MHLGSCRRATRLGEGRRRAASRLAQVQCSCVTPLEEALKKNPHDATAFLVYADALTAEGDAHGQLIQLQYALSKRPEDRHLQAEEQKVRAAVAPEWTNTSVRWELGFPREVTIYRANALIHVLEATKTPMARFIEQANMVGLPHSPQAWELLSRLPMLRGVSFADDAALYGNMPRTGCVAEVQSQLPFLEGLAELRFTAVRLNDADVSALVSSRHCAPARCALVFEAVSVPFSVERQLEASWAFHNSGFTAPALLVEEPPLHRGRVLELREPSVEIGNIGRDLALPESGLLQTHASVHVKKGVCTIRSLGAPASTVEGREVDQRVLEHGDRIQMGYAALRFLERDVDAERQKLKSRADR